MLIVSRVFRGVPWFPVICTMAPPHHGRVRYRIDCSRDESASTRAHEGRLARVAFLRPFGSRRFL